MLQPGDDTSGDDEFRQTGKGEVAKEHGRDRNPKRIGRIERSASGIVKKHGLDAELNPRTKRGHIDSKVSGNRRRNYPARRGDWRTPGKSGVDKIGDE